MGGLFNAISSGTLTNTGNNIITNGDVVEVALGIYQCNESGLNCASSDIMLYPKNLYCAIQCTVDSAACVLDGQSTREVILVQATGGQTLTLRALTFRNGHSDESGCAYIGSDALVDIVLCLIINCRATSSTGGGAIYLTGYSTAVNLYGTQFIGNKADSGNGNDIYRDSGTITIHNTCLSPYTHNATKGKTRIRVLFPSLG